MRCTHPWPQAATAIGLVLGLALAATLAQAAANLLANGGFEQGSFVENMPGYAGGMQLLAGSHAITGWTVGGELAWMTTALAQVPPQEGSRALDLTGFCDLGFNGAQFCNGPVPAGGYGSVTQTIATTPGATYRLRVHGGTYTYGNPAAYVAPTLVATAGSTSQSFQLPDGAPVTGSWTAYSMDFIATATTTTIGLGGTGGQFGHTYYLGVDAASVELVSAPVPEPARAVLLLAGLPLLLGMLRRRRG